MRATAFQKVAFHVVALHHHSTLELVRRIPSALLGSPVPPMNVTSRPAPITRSAAWLAIGAITRYVPAAKQKVLPAA